LSNKVLFHFDINNIKKDHLVNNLVRQKNLATNQQGINYSLSKISLFYLTNVFS